MTIHTIKEITYDPKNLEFPLRDAYARARYQIENIRSDLEPDLDTDTTGRGKKEEGTEAEPGEMAVGEGEDDRPPDDDDGAQADSEDEAVEALQSLQRSWFSARSAHQLVQNSAFGGDTSQQKTKLFFACL